MWLKCSASFNGKTLFMIENSVPSDRVHFFLMLVVLLQGFFFGRSWFCIEFSQSRLPYHIIVKEFYQIVILTFICGLKMENHHSIPL